VGGEGRKLTGGNDRGGRKGTRHYSLSSLTTSDSVERRGTLTTRAITRPTRIFFDEKRCDSEPYIEPWVPLRTIAKNRLLRSAWGIAEAKCILVTRVCVPVLLSFAAFPHYCTDPDVTWRNDRGCPLVVHYWADLQSADGFRCYDNTIRLWITTFLVKKYSRRPCDEMLASACTRSMPGSKSVRAFIPRVLTSVRISRKSVK